MTTKHFLFLTLILTLAHSSCNKVTPAAFWRDYKKDLREKNISDQGPYGGHRAIYWKSNKENPFNSNDVLDFAGKNGWTFIDSLAFNSEQTSKWTYNNRAVFPLTSVGFSDALLNDANLTDFPRWFGGQVSVYKFKTGWIIIEPGKNNSIEENGFVVINDNGTQMAVYHLWGE